MDVTISKCRSNYLFEQENHRISEGIENSRQEKEIQDIINIEQVSKPDFEKNSEMWKREYLSPEVRLTKESGEQCVFNHALVDTDTISPTVTVWKIHDETASYDIFRITRFNAYGIQTVPFEDEFGNNRISYEIFVNKLNGETSVYCPSDYRGFIARYPNGCFDEFGEPTRHSKSIQKGNNEKTIQKHPFSSEDGLMTIRADGNEYTGIRNVTRQEESGFVLHSEIGNKIQVNNVNSVSGALYSVTAKNSSTFGYGMTTTGVQRAIGVYVDENPDFGGDNPILRAVGHPDASSIYRTPRGYKIAELSDLESLVVKTPNGDILNSVDDFQSFNRK